LVIVSFEIGKQKNPTCQPGTGSLALAVFVFRPAGTGGARNLTSNRRSDEF
jgi:hypothetical protein